MPNSAAIRAIRLCVLLLTLALTVSGCLTAEYKETHLLINEDGKSGHGIITFANIVSEPGDSIDVSKEDFNSLISDYYQGKKIEKDNHGMHNVHKKLYVEDDRLMGQVDFDFNDIADIGIFQYKGSGPYMCYTVADGFFTSGQYVASNGTYGGEKMPIIFWDNASKELYFKMSLSTPQEVRKSLVKSYTSWAASQK